MRFVAHAPELLTAVNARTFFPDTSVVVYPDALLSLRELKLMDDFGFKFQSLSQWMSEVP